MSDPPKKPGSLRDRIAAFEKGGSAPSSAPAPAPAPRPKPAGGVSWKPKPLSPPSSPKPADSAHGSDRHGGMSAADAKAAIGQGGSLKERMAALQGQRAFGGAPSPPPKPATEKPKWKPPPVIAAPSSEEGDDAEKPRAATPPARHEPEEVEEPKISGDTDHPPESEERDAEPDPKEEERQRRAAIAARMARLGGARVGMAPPVFAKKPDVKRAEASKVEEDKEKPTESPSPSVGPTVPPIISPPSATSGSVTSEHSDVAATDYFEAKDTGLLSPDSDAAAAVRSPSMPVPVGPRRAAPPRKRAAKSPSPAPAIVLGEGVLNQSPSPVPGVAVEQAAVTNEPVEPHGDREPEMRGSQIETLLANVHISDPDATEETKEAPTGETAQLMGIVRTQEVAEATPDTLHGTEPEQITHIAVESVEPTPHNSIDAIEVPVESEGISGSPTDEARISPPMQAVMDLTEEEDAEIARRKRTAERLAKMGGVNPLAGPPVPTSPPTSPPLPSATPAVVERRQSLRKDSHDSLITPGSQEGVQPSVVRRGSTDSVASRSQLAAAAHETPRSPPMIPSSPKADVLGRKGSVGSVMSTASRELPARSMSQDDHRSVAGYAPGLHEEPESIPESVERTITEEEGEEPVQSHGSYHAPRDVQELIEEERMQRNETQHRYEEELSDDELAETPVEESGDKIFVDEDDERRDGQPDTLPPPISRPPKVPEAYSSSSIVDPQPQQSYPSQVPTPVRSQSKRVSLPPPPRAPPAPPVVQSEYEEDLLEAESAPPPPPVRRDTRPPAPPINQEDDIEPPSASRPVTYLEVRQYEQPGPPSNYSDDEYDQATEEQEYEGPEDVQTDDDPLQPVLTRDQEMKEYEDEETPPPPPPRRASLAVHQTEDLEDDLQIPSRSPSPPPPPPDRRNRPVSHMSHVAPSALSISTAVEPTSIRTKPVPISISTHEQEILDDSDVDPIDPSFFSPQKSADAIPESPLALASAHERPSVVAAPVPEPSVGEERDAEDDPEQARRRTIAERMAKLGGIRFGAPPPAPSVRRPQPPAPTESEDDTEAASPERESGEHEPEQHETLEEDETARKQRIAARIAGMGGMRFGMLPGAVATPPQQPRLSEAEEETEHSRPPAPPQRSAPLPPPPPPPPPPPAEHFDDDGEQIDPEESEAEEISYAEVQEAPPPPVPPREGRRVPAVESQRPPVPSGTRPPVPQVPAMVSRPGRASSGMTVSTDPAFSYPPQPAPVPHDTQGDYIMVEEDMAVEEPPPPPPPRTVSLKRAQPPPRAMPPPPVENPDGQWELPTIPSVDFGGETDLSLSGQWSEDSTNYPPPPVATSGPSATSSRPLPGRTSASRPELQMSSDDLIAQWGRVGVHVHEIASVLFEKSKKSLVGDGSYLGFIKAALGEVPNAAQPEPPFESFGYLIYAQSGAAVQRRVSDLMPGDVIVLHDAKFKGHKGLQSYHQHVGAGEPLYAIIGDYEVKKSKVRVFQANQHVGQQTVESASYRLEDLKSGSIKIFRVLEA